MKCDICGKDVNVDKLRCVIYNYEDVNCACHDDFHREEKLVCLDCDIPEMPTVRYVEDCDKKVSYITAYIKPDSIEIL